LKDEDQNELKPNLFKIEVKSASCQRGDMADDQDQAKPKDDHTKNEDNGPKKDEIDEHEKPKEGVIAHQDGAVAWKFGGATFSGTLVAQPRDRRQVPRQGQPWKPQDTQQGYG
jgi:hypothetical protein